jgi:hypothetical protein
MLKNKNGLRYLILPCAFFLALCFDLSGLDRAIDRAAADEGGYMTAQDSDPVLKVTGKIDTVRRSSFTLTVMPDRMEAPQTQTKTMKFQIDKNTPLQGELQSGARVTVTYREDLSQNVAIRVETNS